MEALGMNIASKAQRSAIRRWFTKQKPVARHLENNPKHSHGEAGLQEKARQANGTSSDADEESRAVSVMCERQAMLEYRRSPNHDNPAFDANDTLKEPLRSETPLIDESNINSQPAESPHVDGAPTGPQPGEEVIMDGLSAECFTETAARIVVGTDGVKPCPVILLTFDLSNKIQEMIAFQRVVRKQEREAQAKLKAITDFKPVVSREILNHKARIARIAESMEESHPTDFEDAIDSVGNLRGELSNLELLEEDVKVREDIIESNLVRRLNFLLEYWEAVNVYLEQAFVDSEAMELARDEEDKPAPILDLQEEYRALVDQMEDFDGNSQPQSLLETGDVFMSDAFQPPTLEQRVHIESEQGLTDARDRLRYAQEQFDRRQENYKRELRQNVEAELSGEIPTDLTIEDFDLRWVEQDRQITRELLEAEEAVSRAKLAAQGVGLEVDGRTQSSCFPDHDADGSPEYASHEPIVREHIARDPRMIAWQESLAESIDPELAGNTVVEADAWGTGEDVGFEDSPSCVAGGTLRKRIDKWERIRSRPASIG